VGDDLRCDQYAEIMSEVVGRPVRYQYIAREQFAALGFAGAAELADMFEFNRLYISNRRHDLEASRKLYPQLRSFEQWVRDEARTLSAAMGLGGSG
jgi:hypothetical protein